MIKPVCRWHNQSREQLEAETEEYVILERQLRQDAHALLQPIEGKFGRVIVPVVMDPKRGMRAARRFMVNSSDLAECEIVEQDDGKFPTHAELRRGSPPRVPLWGVVWDWDGKALILTKDGKWMPIDDQTAKDRIPTFSSEMRAAEVSSQWKGTRPANLRGQ